jgi:hypothetical protein
MVSKMCFQLLIRMTCFFKNCVAFSKFYTSRNGCKINLLRRFVNKQQFPL